MDILSSKQVHEISGGDYLLTVDIVAPSNSVGLGAGFFLNGFLVNTSTTNREIVRTFNSYITRIPYLPGMHITNIDFHQLP